MSRGPHGLAVLAAAILAGACRGQGSEAARPVVRNPDYLVVRSIRRDPDAEHTEQVVLPYSEADRGFVSPAVLLDLSAVEIGEVAFAGGRTSIAGEATIWLPLNAEGRRRLAEGSQRHAGDYLGLYLKGRLVAAPRIGTVSGGGIPLRVGSKREGDAVLEELRSGGVAR